MFRKIAFLALNLFENLEALSKLLIYIFPVYLNSLFTFFSRPFVLRESNVTEYYSNISLVLTIFAYLVYILAINEFIKTLFFIIAILVNIFFQLNWLIRAIEILCYAHLRILKRYFPSFLKKIFALINAFKTIDIKLNRSSLQRFIASYNVLKKSHKINLIFEGGKFNCEIRVDSKKKKRIFH